MFITLTKEELLKLLSAQELRAKAEDKRVAKAHKDDERSALTKFRDDCRAALKWDYPTAKQKNQDWSSRIEFRTPSCPMLESPRFSTMIANINRDMRKSPYRIHDGSDIDKALKWVPKSERASSTVCEGDE